MKTGLFLMIFQFNKQKVFPPSKKFFFIIIIFLIIFHGTKWQMSEKVIPIREVGVQVGDPTVGRFVGRGGLLWGLLN